MDYSDALIGVVIGVAVAELLKMFSSSPADKLEAELPFGFKSKRKLSNLSPKVEKVLNSENLFRAYRENLKFLSAAERNEIKSHVSDETRSELESLEFWYNAYRKAMDNYALDTDYSRKVVDEIHFRMARALQNQMQLENKYKITENIREIIEELSEKVSPRILAFDFDRTLTPRHIANEILQGKSKENLQFSRDDLVFSDDFIRRLEREKQLHNLRIYIVSYGYRDAIEKFLDQVGISHLISGILTPADCFYDESKSEYICDLYTKYSENLREGYDTLHPVGKNPMLKFLHRISLAPNSSIVLVDDSESNISKALEHGYRAIGVPRWSRDIESKISRQI